MELSNYRKLRAGVENKDTNNGNIQAVAELYERTPKDTFVPCADYVYGCAHPVNEKTHQNYEFPEWAPADTVGPHTSYSLYDIVHPAPAGTHCLAVTLLLVNCW
jgi:hypothetical protein